MVILAVAIAVTSLHWARIACSDEEATDEQFQQLIRKMQVPSPGHELMKPIDDAERSGDLEKVIALCEELLARPIESFDTPQYGAAIKSFAWNHRGYARA